MSFTDAGAVRTTKRTLDGHEGTTPDRSHLRMENSSQGIPHQHKPESRPEQMGSTASHTTISAAPVKSATPDDLTPSQTAQRLVEWSIAKSVLSLDRLIVLGLLAGAFIAVGGAFFTAVMAELSLSHGPSRLLGGLAFSTGLLLVCMSGAELSTGNCMILPPGPAADSHLATSGATCLFRTQPMRWAHWRWFCWWREAASFKRDTGALRSRLPKQK